MEDVFSIPTALPLLCQHPLGVIDGKAIRKETGGDKDPGFSVQEDSSAFMRR